MEFIKSKMYGGEVTAVFTGSKYFLFSSWYGLFAVAERNYNAEGEGKAEFTIFVDKDKYKGGDWQEFCKVAKRVINKNESKYITQEVSYKIEFANVERWAVKMELVK